jgi:hypothetical protein
VSDEVRPSAFLLKEGRFNILSLLRFELSLLRSCKHNLMKFSPSEKCLDIFVLFLTDKTNNILSILTTNLQKELL